MKIKELKYEQEGYGITISKGTKFSRWHSFYGKRPCAMTLDSCISECILSKDKKPFACKIWPFRVTKIDKELVIALTTTFPTVNKQSFEKLNRA